MDIKNNILFFQKEAIGAGARLVTVSKTQSIENIRLAYDAGQRIFGENKVQEMAAKAEVLPKDIAWHMIGHLQTNKVKYIAPFAAMIHSVDSLKLVAEVDRQAKKAGRVLPCLLQVHIAMEETKFGFDESELLELFDDGAFAPFTSVCINGLMGMASLTTDNEKIKSEFSTLKNLFEKIKQRQHSENIDMKELSMGMSSDYKIALSSGSTLIRVGSSIFGERHAEN